MKIQWRPTKQLLGGQSCVEHITTRELSIFGRYGEIWSSGATTYKAVIFSHRIVRRFLSKEKWATDLHDEILIRFEAQELRIWTQRLRVPAKATTQAKIANQTRIFESIKSNIGAGNVKILSSEALIQSQIGNESTLIPPTGHSVDLPPGSENPDEPIKGQTKDADSGGGI